MGALAVSSLGSSTACSSGASGATAPDAGADSPAPTGDGPTGTTDVNDVLDAPEGAPVVLPLDQTTPFELGAHCGRTAVFFDDAHASAYVLDVTVGGKVHAASSVLNMVNASVYCTFTLPAGTKSVALRRGLANIQIDPANGAASASASLAVEASSAPPSI